MHVAEQPAEVDECLAEHGVRPVQLLHRNGVLDPNFTGIHAIHITPGEIDHLGAARAQVCACPTTERNLADGPVPAHALMRAGVGICLGSDSNVQIDLLEDARSLEYDLRMATLERAILAPESLFAAATEQGAAALGAPTGDYFTIDLNDPSIAGSDPDALRTSAVFSLERTAIRDVFVNGRRIVSEGRHPLQEQIIQDFSALQNRLWPKL
jgi:formimidoylglutamate deiminase